ncbi:hypothetical protein [Parasitella parasitica]|uniref:Endonuclease/exonuclease/phosphatase domain-containing protein n=1 Tax=Parasitella parasitica TaxID=35722 RepID=A0A0B7NXV7_9FUNG|nr:hypothetical protein [Parasitella parasitica]
MNSLNHISNIDAISSSTNWAYFSNTTSNPRDTSFIKLNIGSLNCRGLSKTSATSTRDHFIRYLRTRSLDLLALQETHASCYSLQALFHSQFQATASLWSPHYGLVFFSSDIAFSDTVISVCGRIISTTISHSSDAFDLFITATTVMYFPASRPERFIFLSNLLSDYDFVFVPSPVRLVILGDFNYTYSSSSTYSNRQGPAAWLKYIDDDFINGITAPGASISITFQRGTSISILHRLCLFICRPHISDTPTRCIHSLDGTLLAAQKWELLKQKTATVAKSFSKRPRSPSLETLWHTKQIGFGSFFTPYLANTAIAVEEQLAALQQNNVKNLALRSGIRWREKGETSADFPKRTVSSRASRKLILPLIPPQLLSDFVPRKNKCLMKPPPTTATFEAFSPAHAKSSLGINSLPCQLVRLIVLHPECRKIALATFNNSLFYSDIPPSWLESCITHLPKKGALNLLQNWHPISLINTDAKVFTRILSGRMIDIAAHLINPFQTGFVRGRFIADNGLLMNLVMEYARRDTQSTDIGLLLGQEKAYDRVHPIYLS